MKWAPGHEGKGAAKRILNWLGFSAHVQGNGEASNHEFTAAPLYFHLS
jgi:hypothetical protein